MPMGRPSSSNQLPYDSGHYSFPHMFLQHTVEQDRAPHVLPHYPELARHASRQPPRGHRTDRKHHDENRSQNPLRTRSRPLSQGHQDLRRANGDTQHKTRFLPSRMELQHLAQTLEHGAIIFGRRRPGPPAAAPPPLTSGRCIWRLWPPTTDSFRSTRRIARRTSRTEPPWSAPKSHAWRAARSTPRVSTKGPSNR